MYSTTGGKKHPTDKGSTTATEMGSDWGRGRRREGGALPLPPPLIKSLVIMSLSLSLFLSLLTTAIPAVVVVVTSVVLTLPGVLALRGVGIAAFPPSLSPPLSSPFSSPFSSPSLCALAARGLGLEGGRTEALLLLLLLSVVEDGLLLFARFNRIAKAYKFANIHGR